MNKRSFLRTSNCALIGSTSVFNTLMNMRLLSSVSAQTNTQNDYKALVCVLLNGGNDSFNMLIPTSSGEYSTYLASRSNVALSTTGDNPVLQIAPSNTNGKTYGIHPSMPKLKALYDQGDAVFVSNVGTMIKPTTKLDFTNNSVPIPNHLYSHRDQAVQWQTAINQGQTTLSGWAGRMADYMVPQTASNGDFFGISLAGRSFFQVGKFYGSYPISSTGATPLDTKDSKGIFDLKRNSAMKSLVDQEYNNLFQKVYAKEVKKSFDLEGQFNKAFNASTITTPFPSTSIGQQLLAVAKSIKSRDDLGSKRQTFYVEHGSYDLHSQLLSFHSTLLADLDDAFRAFRDAMIELGLNDQVTLFTVSDFARTLRSNGNGTDHAWGGNHIVVGGAVKGNKMYGQYPDLSLSGSSDVTFNGIMLPTTSADQYFAELATWFGIPATHTALKDILPNIPNFDLNTVDFL